MALTIGDVAINPTTGGHTGSGLALAVFEAIDDSTRVLSLAGPNLAFICALPDSGLIYGDEAVRVVVEQKTLARTKAIAIASAIINHITANAVVVGAAVT